MTTYASRLHQAHLHAEKLANAAYKAAGPYPQKKSAAYLKVYRREMLAFAQLEAMRTPEDICQEALR